MEIMVACKCMYGTVKGGKLVTANGPAPVIGNYGAISANPSNQPWGGVITTTPVTGDVVFVADNTVLPL